jgi:hypothetical protein
MFPSHFRFSKGREVSKLLPHGEQYRYTVYVSSKSNTI